MTSIKHSLYRWSSLVLLFSITMAACSSPAPAATATPEPTHTPAATNTPAPTASPEPTPTIPRTPPPLPALFTTDQLAPFVTPHIYNRDACGYLNLKWDPNNSPPGTIVIAVMFHGIVHGAEVTKANDISFDGFNQMMTALKEQGFEAINANQLADFLDTNAKIPPRSVILIADDRHYADYFNRNFRANWEKWGWPVVNAWISHPDTLQGVWSDNEALAAEGWVDHQAHGVIHNNVIWSKSTDEYILNELVGSTVAIQEHYGHTPVAIIWPGGGFTARSAELARQSGYRIGFTVNARGPMMFNWIPLADQVNPDYPLAMAEGPAYDPLMVLPRYWPTMVVPNLDKIRVMGKQAAAYAEQVKDTELEFYEIVCEPIIGPIPPLAESGGV